MLLEEAFMHSQGIEGPVELELQFDDDKKTRYLTETLMTNKTEDTLPALQRLRTRIDNLHKCKSVWILHSDRAPELVGPTVVSAMLELGITVTSTAGVDPNSNGRAERGVRWIKERARTLFGSARHREIPLWSSARTHASEFQLRSWRGDNKLPEVALGHGTD